MVGPLKKNLYAASLTWWWCAGPCCYGANPWPPGSAPELPNQLSSQPVIDFRNVKNFTAKHEFYIASMTRWAQQYKQVLTQSVLFFISFLMPLLFLFLFGSKNGVRPCPTWTNLWGRGWAGAAGVLRLPLLRPGQRVPTSLNINNTT